MLTSALKLREYTVKFGRCLTDLYDDLVATAFGRPPLPESGHPPPAKQSYEALPADGFDLGYAKLEEVYTYLRRGKGLVIPADWSHLIPKPQ